MTPLPELLGVERAADSVEIRLRISPGLAFFPHHFPELQLVPGVVMLSWAITYGAEYLGLQGPFRKLLGLKFQRPIRPGAQVRLTLARTPAGELSFHYQSSAHTYASGRIAFA